MLRHVSGNFPKRMCDASTLRDVDFVVAAFNVINDETGKCMETTDPDVSVSIACNHRQQALLGCGSSSSLKSFHSGLFFSRSSLFPLCFSQLCAIPPIEFFKRGLVQPGAFKLLASRLCRSVNRGGRRSVGPAGWRVRVLCGQGHARPIVVSYAWETF